MPTDATPNTPPESWRPSRALPSPRVTTPRGGAFIVPTVVPDVWAQFSENQLYALCRRHDLVNDLAKVPSRDFMSARLDEHADKKERER